MTRAQQPGLALAPKRFGYYGYGAVSMSRSARWALHTKIAHELPAAARRV